MIRIFMMICLIPALSRAHADDLSDIRKEYYAAINNAGIANRFYVSLKERDRTDPLLMAYFGSAQALKARYSWNPFNKMDYLKESNKTLEEAVSKSGENLEIRFLRFALQHYLPPFLGYSHNLEADRKKIIELIRKKQFGLMDKELLANMIKFMKDSKRCTPRELEVLNRPIS